MDQILTSELEFLVEDDEDRVKSRLKKMASTHLSRSTINMEGGKTNVRGTSMTNDASNSLQKNSDRVFERPGKETSMRNGPPAGGDTETNAGDETSMPNSRRVPDRETMLRVLYRLRHLHLRSLRRRLLGLLNYSRSVQRRIVLDSTGFTFQNKSAGQRSSGATQTTSNLAKQEASPNNRPSSYDRCTNPCLDMRHEIHDVPADLVHSAAELMHSDLWAIDGRDDDCEMESGVAYAGHNIVHVLDPSGRRVIYDCALADLEAQEQLFLSVGTDVLRYTEARLASINRQEQTAEMSGTHVAEGTVDDFEGKGESFVSFTTVDRLGVLKDLFEKEVELREACRNIWTRYFWHMTIPCT